MSFPYDVAWVLIKGSIKLIYIALINVLQLLQYYMQYCRLGWK